MDTSFGDTSSRWDRIGGRYLYPKIAWGMIGLFLLIVGFVGLIVAFQYSKVANLAYKDMISDVRYHSIKH